jgi:hypothetical protein
MKDLLANQAAQSLHAPDAIKIFKFKMLIPYCIWAVCIMVLCVFLDTIAIKREGFHGAFAFITFSLAGLESLGAIGILGSSDIIINDWGISRCLFGKTVQAINWSNAKRIWLFNFTDLFTQKTVKAFTIYPLEKPQFRILPGGKIVFGEECTNIDELLSLLNHYAVKHRIPIEREVDGKPTPVDHI